MTEDDFASLQRGLEQAKAYMAETEVDRLNALIDATAQIWLDFQQTHPVPWEGAIDGAMAAACGRIEALTAEVERLREALVKVAAECRVPVGNDTVMYVRWRALAVERVDIARAALEGKQ